MNIYHSVEELIGHTPLLALSRIGAAEGLTATVLAKLERFNPGGSAKDRIAKEMLDRAIADGRLQDGGTVIEPTSGNTGIGLALVAAARGFRAILVMPDSMSAERRALLAAYGATLVLTDGALGMAGAIAKAKELAETTENSFLAGQFDNPDNPRAHYLTTGPEIFMDTDGKVDVLVAAVGTGGTLCGVGKYLKEQNQNVQVIAVEPQASPVLSGGKAGPHKIQGIGAGFVPSVLDTDVYDEVIAVSDEAAFAAARQLATAEGVLCGISSGAALAAAIEVAKRPSLRGKTVVVVLNDTGERYLSAGVFTRSE